jgi:hypothetical protein
MDNQQLAELLSGIAKANNAILDAFERAHPGFKSSHLAPVLNVAANMRSAEPRLVDLPSRILLRYQGRAAVDTAVILADIERLTAAPARPGPGDDLDFSAKPA